MIHIYDPTMKSAIEPLRVNLMPRPLSSQVRLGIIDNSKPNFDFLATDLAELLTEQHGVELVETVHKHSAAAPASDTVYDRLALTCDLVLSGSGD
jgi:hypothetical protein